MTVRLRTRCHRAGMENWVRWGVSFQASDIPPGGVVQLTKGGSGGVQGPDWLQRLQLCPLERDFLSRGTCSTQVVRVLLRVLRFRGTERDFLPHSAPEDLREVVCRNARGIRICPERQPIHHPCQKAPGPARTPRTIL